MVEQFANFQQEITCIPDAEQTERLIAAMASKDAETSALRALASAFQVAVLLEPKTIELKLEIRRGLAADTSELRQDVANSEHFFRRVLETGTFGDRQNKRLSAVRDALERLGSEMSEGKITKGKMNSLSERAEEFHSVLGDLRQEMQAAYNPVKDVRGSLPARPTDPF